MKRPSSLFPSEPPPGPTRPGFWKSPLRGPWLTSLLGSALLPLILICAITGFLSQLAYSPELGGNNVLPGGGLGWDIFPFAWPTKWAYLYAVTQGLHVISGVIAIPLLFGKLWSVMPRLFEWPPLRSVAHMFERVVLALLVGGSLFVFFTGVMNIQLYYPWNFSFVPSHYYASFIFLTALALHVGFKFSTARRAFREQGVLRPLRNGLGTTEPEPFVEDSTTSPDPAAPTISRRAFFGTIGVASLGMGFMMAAQSIGGPLRSLGLLAPHGRDYGDGPTDFPVNKTAEGVGVTVEQTGPSWRLRLEGGKTGSLSRNQLLAMPQHTCKLPIACVEGWSTTQTWTGVRLRDLASAAGAAGASQVLVQSLQEAGSFNKATLSSAQIDDERSLLALKVNGVDLSMDHGFPARIIVPAIPGVHATKWVSNMIFEAA